MLRTFKFRIYPSKQQRAALERNLSICRSLYNDSLAERKEVWEKEHKAITYKDQQDALPPQKKAEPELTEVHSQVLQDVLRRVDNSFKNFFRRVKRGEKPGYPRFKAAFRYDSFTYPQFGNGTRLEGKRLWLSKIGEINIKLHREIPLGAEIKTCTVRREVDRWYVCLTADLPYAPVEKPIRSAVGVDAGLTDLLTLSTGEKIANPHWLKKSEEKLAFAQRQLSKKKRGSKNRWKQRLRVARIYRKIKDQRRDFAHKLSRTLVENYDLIVFEKLQVQQMMQNGFLSKFIGDASWSQLMNFTTYKAEEAGSLVEFVNPKDTTQGCSRCGHIVPKTLKDRVHNCPYCGFTADRDLNAAQNILIRATAGHAGSNASGNDAKSIAYERGSPHLPI